MTPLDVAEGLQGLLLASCVAAAAVFCSGVAVGWVLCWLYGRCR